MEKILQCVFKNNPFKTLKHYRLANKYIVNDKMSINTCGFQIWFKNVN